MAKQAPTLFLEEWLRSNSGSVSNITSSSSSSSARAIIQAWADLRDSLQNQSFRPNHLQKSSKPSSVQIDSAVQILLHLVSTQFDSNKNPLFFSSEIVLLLGAFSFVSSASEKSKTLCLELLCRLLEGEYRLISSSEQHIPNVLAGIGYALSSSGNVYFVRILDSLLGIWNRACALTLLLLLTRDSNLDVTGDWSLGTIIGLKAKFESPESHWSDFGGERKPISNSDQIRSAQKWCLSIPPDSSRRDEAPAPNRVKIERRTHPHAPPEVSAQKPFLSFLGIPNSSARITPYEKSRMKDTERDEQEDDWANQTMHWTRDQVEGDVPREDISEQSLNEEACVEASERDYSGGINERVPESHMKRSKEETREEVSRRRSQMSGEERDKKNCPRNKAQDQSSEAATTAMMAVDESDVLLAASADEESDWISDSRIAYHLCRDREWRNTQSFQGKHEKLQEKEDWKTIPTEGESRQEELLSDIGPVEPKEMLWDTCESLARHEKMQSVQDVHEEAQRKETEELYSDRRDDAETREMESRRLAKRRTLQRTPVRGSRTPKSYRGAGPEVVGMDNLKNSEYPPMGWRGRLLDPAQIGGPTQSQIGSQAHREAQPMERPSPCPTYP
ncbi:hypothetical protein Acr_00g0032960 [Actinidia rufa]|uniref:Uncharacterized protein n=1 Tax=Actinidia rufa TaxID=165716 RepID=A0A7J0DFR3_9ERIC|nr:hypothetical protein Acr_00g0032960 [Actinidia rufa]